MTIRALPPEVADAIAAGEVVERPASVVKELVENALDAGATRVAVEIRGAGRNLIRVADDGIGIPGSELRLAFQRHATSKVATVADLESISTLGFRGEALASIAAAADVRCTSGGRTVHINGGLLVEEGPAPPTPGTAVEVRDLFLRTPARLKFLKTDSTETAACLRVVQQYSLLRPGIRFQVLVDGRSTLQTPGSDLSGAISAVHGSAVAAAMIPIAAERTSGAISRPQLSRGNRDAVVLAVNGRPIVSRPLAFAIDECYRGSLERGRFPIAVIDLEVDPAAIDVNVHPAKREVRFRDEGTVFSQLQRSVRAALANGEEGRRAAPEPSPSRPTLSGRATVTHQLNLHEAPTEMVADGAPNRAAGVLRPLGQVRDGYLVAEGPEGVVLIDQHAAHERILFNRFKSRFESGGANLSQALLLALTIEVDAAGMAGFGDHEGELRRLGFELEPFGSRTLRVRAAPMETPPSRVEACIREVLTGLRSRSVHDALASLACHSAVRFGDSLEAPEQRRLIEELETAAPAETCPHGRPTRMLLSWRDLTLHFRRNY